MTGIQVGEIREWLEQHEFQRQEGQPEQWIHAETTVRLTQCGQRWNVDIRYGAIGNRWKDIGKLLALSNSWPEAITMLPIAVVTSPGFRAHMQEVSFRRDSGRWLYDKAQPWAHGLKVFLQMIVGVGAVVDIIWHVEQATSAHKGTAPLFPSITTSVSVVAAALAVAAAIELAYTLFTPGPDETLEPLMLGLSSGILFLITENDPKTLSAPAQFTAVLLGVVALGLLFFIRRRFLLDDDEQ